MDINKPVKENLSLKNVAWGSPEFREIINKAKKQQDKQQEYEQCVEAIRSIQGD